VSQSLEGLPSQALGAEKEACRRKVFRVTCRNHRFNLRLQEGRSAESRATNGAKLEYSYAEISIAPLLARLGEVAEILVPISSTGNHIPYYPKRFAVLGQSSEKFNRPVPVANASPSVLPSDWNLGSWSRASRLLWIPSSLYGRLATLWDLSTSRSLRYTSPFMWKLSSLLLQDISHKLLLIFKEAPTRGLF